MNPSFLALSLLLSALPLSLAQSATIGLPLPNSVLVAGSEITVQIKQAESSSDVDQVAIIIGLAGCPDGTCASYDPALDGLGAVLYQGPFAPARDPAEPQEGAYQNFTVTVPAFVSGNSSLSLVHLQTVGAVKVPFYEVNDVTVSVVSA